MKARGWDNYIPFPRESQRATDNTHERPVRVAHGLQAPKRRHSRPLPSTFLLRKRFPVITAITTLLESPLTPRVILSAPTHSLAKLCPHVLWQQQDVWLLSTTHNNGREEMENEVASGSRSKDLSWSMDSWGDFISNPVEWITLRQKHPCCWWIYSAPLKPRTRRLLFFFAGITVPL